MSKCCAYLKSSIGQKQIVALTGLLLIGFVAVHLAGNLSIYAGAGAFNAYAAKLKSLRPFLNGVEAVLVLIFLVHMGFTIHLVKTSRRQNKYALKKDKGDFRLGAKTMRYTGPLLLVYVIWHLLDYTFASHHGAQSMINGVDQGLFGLVANSFQNPIRVVGYIIAMICVGLHLDHGLQSFLQTFGLVKPGRLKCLQKLSRCVAVVLTVGYSSIPLYLMWMF